MFGHGGGGWDDWPHFSRMKISCFDFVRFSLRLFLDAQASFYMGYFTFVKRGKCFLVLCLYCVCRVFCGASLVNK